MCRKWEVTSRSYQAQEEASRVEGYSHNIETSVSDYMLGDSLEMLVVAHTSEVYKSYPSAKGYSSEELIMTRG